MQYIPRHATAADYPQPSVFAVMLDMDTLIAAWLGIRRNRGGPGGDGVTIGYIEPDFRAHLERLRDQIRAGSYVPGPVRRVSVRKKSGGRRTLAIPCVIDRIAQKALAIAAGPLFEAEFEDSSYAYRPGRSVDLAARQVTRLWQQGYEWVVDADIRAFFDNVPHGPLLLRLQDLLPEPPVCDLVMQWLAAAGDDTAASGQPGAGRGLPQGAPMMPHLANLYLDQLDEELLMSGLRLVRYADDFLLLARSRAEAETGLAQARLQLARMGLELNTDKTGIRNFADGFDFLGRRFLRSFLVDDEDGLDAEERAAVVRLNDAAEARGGQPRPLPVRQFGGKWHDEPVPADILAPDGADAPFIIRPTAEDPGPVPVAEAEVFRVLYLNTPGSTLEARGDSLVARRAGAEVWARAPEGISRVEIGPSVEVSSSALRLAATRGVPLYWVTAGGAVVARVEPPLADVAGLHLAQAALALDGARALAFSRIIAAGRLRAARSVIMGWKQNLARKAASAEGERRARIDAVLSAIGAESKPLNSDIGKCALAATVGDLRPIEAAGVKRYWKVFRASVGHWSMGARSRPAADPANAVLNYCAALLQRDVETSARAAGLHPGIGVYHVTHDYADALIYDLMEEFRAPVAEALTNELLNQNVLDAVDFSEGEGQVLISTAGRGEIIRAWQQFVTRRDKGLRHKPRKSWRMIMRAQSRAFARSLRDDTAYEPVHRDY